MARIISIASGKGGVGKTTLVANLAAALARFNKKVIAIDGNLTTANLGLHCGIPQYPNTIQDVIKRKKGLSEAMYHHPAGFSVMPADVALDKIVTPSSGDLVDIFYGLTHSADFILVDSAAGLGREAMAAIEACDEVIIVTNPEMTALTDALKIAKLAESYGSHNTGVVLNRMRNERMEFNVSDVRDFLTLPVIGGIPEDHNVRKAIAIREPVVHYKPNAPASREIISLAARLIGKEHEIPQYNILTRLFGWLR